MNPRLAGIVRASLLFWVPVLWVSVPLAHAASEETERWYDNLRNGQKSGYFRVVWAPSTWEGRKTVHDTTLMVQRESRSMDGMQDRFESSLTIDLERDADGRLWWQRTRREEGSRTIEDELVWTGSGYRLTSRLVRGAADAAARAPRVIEITAKQPVHTDAESMLGPHVRKGGLKAGATFALRSLDVPGRRTDEQTVTFLAEETWTPEGGEPQPAWAFRQVHVKSSAETKLWLDADGALVRLIGEGGTEIRRTTAERARKMPVRPAEYSITVPASPDLERVFHADALDIEIHLQGDEHRKRPDYPKSPWSEVTHAEGSDEAGWRIHASLHSYYGTGKDIQIPVAPDGFERELESTVLMPVAHPTLKATAAEAIGDETSARAAAHKLARFVYASLAKRSPDVAQASALEILEQRCGDCSEHALLFVALCRAAGIPARRCSGFVCIGSLWGSHAWAEVWVGEWVGADPTTGELGTGARYLFFGYSDMPNSYPGVVSSRSVGRMRILTTRLREGAATFDLTDRDQHVREAPGHLLSVLSGLEAEHIPEEWTVRVSRADRLNVRAEGLRAIVSARADQGARMDTRRRSFSSAIETTFAGAPALHHNSSRGGIYEVYSRKRVVRVIVLEGGPKEMAALERVLAPTFLPKPRPWTDAPTDDNGDDGDK